MLPSWLVLLEFHSGCFAFRSPASSVGSLFVKSSFSSSGRIVLSHGLYAEMTLMFLLFAIRIGPVVVSIFCIFRLGCSKKCRFCFTIIAVSPFLPFVWSVLKVLGKCSLLEALSCVSCYVHLVSEEKVV